MKFGKKLIAFLTVSAAAVNLSACAGNTNHSTNTASAETQPLLSVSAEETQSDASAAAKKASKPDITVLALPENGENTLITLEHDTALIKGAGAELSGNDVIIKKAGVYTVSGVLDNGRIYIDAGKKDNVFLVLDGAEIRNENDPAIYTENAAHTQIVLKEGTFNKIISGTETDIFNTEKTSDEDISGGAIYSKDDLSVTGTGNLSVFGYINNGIQTADSFIADSGNIEITALNNGLKGKDSVVLTGGSFDIKAGGDGIKSDNSESGSVYISGGKITLETSGDGIQSEIITEITDGELNIISGGGSENASSANRPDLGGGFGKRGQNMAWDMDDENNVSSKGIKCGGELNIFGGNFTINSADDGLHSDGSMYIADGTFEISSGDDGIHANNSLTADGGIIKIKVSYEGIESNQIYINGGEINVTSSDDGFNAYGGTFNIGRGEWGRGKDGAPLEDSDSKPSEVPNLYINGGNIYVNAGGDGLDSNGNIYVSGGTVIVDGPENDGNGALDTGSESGGVCRISGGTVLAAGSAGMAETFGSGSAQCSFRHNFGSALPSGSEIKISDTRGNVLFTHTSAGKFSSVVFSAAELKQGETYILSAGDQSAEITLNSVSESSGEAVREWGNPGGGFGNNFDGNFKPDFDENFKPDFDENFKPDFDENFKPDFDENFKPDFDENFKPDRDREPPEGPREDNKTE